MFLDGLSFLTNPLNYKGATQGVEPVVLSGLVRFHLEVN